MHGRPLGNDEPLINNRIRESPKNNNLGYYINENLKNLYEPIFYVPAPIGLSRLMESSAPLRCSWLFQAIPRSEAKWPSFQRASSFPLIPTANPCSPRSFVRSPRYFQTNLRTVSQHLLFLLMRRNPIIRIET